MGQLIAAGGTEVHHLRSHEVLGRSRSSTICIESPSVSGCHAILAWSGLCWTLRDASSLNGTFVDTVVLPPGAEVTLTCGAEIRLGHDKTFVLTDDGPPRALAETDDDRLVGTSGLLGIPNTESPEVAVMFDNRTRQWWAERVEHRHPVHDGDSLDVAGQTWRLSLPEVLAPTHRLSRKPYLEDIHVQLTVSADEETVQIRLTHGERTWTLPPRSHHYSLLTLARARLADATLHPDEAGWVDRHQLLKQLAINENLLYTHLFRARREFDRLGIDNANGLIERRAGAGQLRIGLHRITVERAGGEPA